MVRSRELEPEIIDVQENTDRRVATEDEKLKENENNFESGYSEAEQAKDIEARSGDLSYLKKSTAFQQSHGSARILLVYKEVSQQVTDLLERYLQLVEKNVRQAQSMRDDLIRMRAMQKLLLTKLFGKLEGEFPNRKELEEEINELLES